MLHIFKTSEDIQQYIDTHTNYTSKEELINSYNPLISDFSSDDAYNDINNFKSDSHLDSFTTQYDGVLGALQITYFETHPNINPLDHVTAIPDLVTLDNMPEIKVIEPEETIIQVNRWRIRQYLNRKD